MRYVVRLFSFDITKRITFFDRRSKTTECDLEKTKKKPCFNLRHYSVVNDLLPSSRYLINCISNTRGRSQTETSTRKYSRPACICNQRPQNTVDISTKTPLKYITVPKPKYLINSNQSQRNKPFLG